jgi:phosphoribosylformylglycinamidine cyclo-ligase
VRRLLEASSADLEGDLDGRPLGEALLAPTRIYVKSLLTLIGELPVHALAHITGGGLTENLPRVLPADSRALIDLGSWARPAVFRWLQAAGNVTEAEMLRTFNCGVGLVLILPDAQAEPAMARLAELGEQAWRLGRVEAAAGAAEVRCTGAWS